MITAGAMHCRHEDVDYLAARGSQWILTVKRNQPHLHQRLSKLPWRKVPQAARHGPRRHLRRRPQPNPHRDRTAGSLRWAEVVVLQRCDVILSAGTVRVRQAFVEHRGTGLILGPPKSKAGMRAVALRNAALPMLKQHMGKHIGEAADAFVFTGESPAQPVARQLRQAGQVARGGSGHRCDRAALPRPAAYRQLARVAGTGREPAGHHGADGPRQPARRVDLQHTNREADHGIADAIDQTVKGGPAQTGQAQAEAGHEGRRTGR
ncbi:hypothetical protein ACWKSP_25185 [Micromonosporaceae bacterium Da 78-11]